MNMTIELKNYGTSFATRSRAVSLVVEFSTVIRRERPQQLMLDFTGVNVVSPSFATEFVVSLLRNLRSTEYKPDTIQFVGNSPLVKDRVLRALKLYATNSPTGRKQDFDLDKVLVT
ncbi:MAG: DUF4325 domain-containing protein [Chloroflexi bacterium]|nr:DUF4325 domain-containing protein [Chloroflexota bacterium]